MANPKNEDSGKSIQRGVATVVHCKSRNAWIAPGGIKLKNRGEAVWLAARMNALMMGDRNE